jgi:hypothetical protein
VGEVQVAKTPTAHLVDLVGEVLGEPVTQLRTILGTNAEEMEQMAVPIPVVVGVVAEPLIPLIGV